jgi:REP element-mobilizing transposase RayT
MPTTNKFPQGHRLRIGRFSESNRAYLLTTVTYQRRLVFHDIYLARIVVQAMQHQHRSGQINSMAYVVMPDHVHWLVQLMGDNNLGSIMRCFKGFTAFKINQALGETGRFWQSGYHDHAIREEENIRTVARYIIANPLRAGLVEQIEDYALWDAVWL